MMLMLHNKWLLNFYKYYFYNCAIVTFPQSYICRCSNLFTKLHNYELDHVVDCFSLYRTPRECCTALLEDWVTTDNGVKPKTWKNFIEVLSDIEELESVIEDIKQCLISVALDGVYTFVCMHVRMYVHTYVCIYVAKQKQPGCKIVRGQLQSEATMVISDQKL